MTETELLARIVIDPKIFGGKPIIGGRRLAVEHVLGMLAAGDTPQTILEGYPWLVPEDIQACLLYKSGAFCAFQLKKTWSVPDLPLLP